MPRDRYRLIQWLLPIVLGTPSLTLIVTTPSPAQTEAEIPPLPDALPPAYNHGQERNSSEATISVPPLQPNPQPIAPEDTDCSEYPHNRNSCDRPTPSLAQNNPANQGLSLYLGSRIPNPTASVGPTGAPITPVASDLEGGVNITVGSQLSLSERQRLALELRGGTSVLGVYFGYLYVTQSPRQGFSIYGFNQRSFSAALQEGERDVELPGGDNPWVHRLGGGVEGYIPVGAVDTAIGVAYQRVSVRDDIFTSTLEPVDELDNSLTVSDEGQDDLLTFNLAAQYDTRDNPRNPTQGTRLRLGVDQSIPVGDAAIAMTRLNASATQFIPFSLFGFTEGARTLVVNFQGGHIFGDAPFYEAFSLGGSNSVRGYSRGEVGTGRSYIQTTVEYRFPIASFTAFNEGVELGGALFVDYGDLLGTQDGVIGDPGLVRDKPGEGLGFGVGLRAFSGLATGRAELGISDRGDVEFHFSVGQRF